MAYWGKCTLCSPYLDRNPAQYLADILVIITHREYQYTTAERLYSLITFTNCRLRAVLAAVLKQPYSDKLRSGSETFCKVEESESKCTPLNDAHVRAWSKR